MVQELGNKLCNNGVHGGCGKCIWLFDDPALLCRLSLYALTSMLESALKNRYIEYGSICIDKSMIYCNGRTYLNPGNYTHTRDSCTAREFCRQVLKAWTYSGTVSYNAEFRVKQLYYLFMEIKSVDRLQHILHTMINDFGIWDNC